MKVGNLSLFGCVPCDRKNDGNTKIAGTGDLFCFPFVLPGSVG